MNEQSIFLAALDREPQQRPAFLDEACAGNETLRRGVETLLQFHAQSSDFLEVPAVEQLGLGASAPRSSADLSGLAPSSDLDSRGRLDGPDAPVL